MKKRFSYICFRIIRRLIWIIYPKLNIQGMENLPEEPCIIVSNHAQMRGPIACELHLPGEHATWCAGEMMNMKEVPAYAFEDFWRDKPLWNRWFYKLLSYIIAPISVCVFNNARTIGVYHDARIFTTFRKTMDHLSKGENVIIMPEGRKNHNNIINDFQEGFLDIARVYNRRTGGNLNFVPMYIAPYLRMMYIGKPIEYNCESPALQEKERIKKALMDGITDIALSLPRHKVFPYGNVPKKEYPMSKE